MYTHRNRLAYFSSDKREKKRRTTFQLQVLNCQMCKGSNAIERAMTSLKKNIQTGRKCCFLPPPFKRVRRGTLIKGSRQAQICNHRNIVCPLMRTDECWVHWFYRDCGKAQEISSATRTRRSMVPRTHSLMHLLLSIFR